jgi:hypothetical protein
MVSSQSVHFRCMDVLSTRMLRLGNLSLDSKSLDSSAVRRRVGLALHFSKTQETGR